MLKFLTLTALAALSALPLNAQGAAKPNILLILADDQGYGDLACTGNPHVRTPHIDSLAREGITFDRFFVSPLCAPTRASLLTGRDSLRTGVFGVTRGEETMHTGEITIAKILQSSGYKTGIFGKWHNGENYPHTPQANGFGEVFGFNLGHWNNYFDTTLKHNNQPVKTKGYIADVLTDEALKFVENNQKQPFFCYLAFNTPHSPFQVPEAYFQRYKVMGLDDKRACVFGMCENIDDNVGRMLQKLDALKLREDTIVIYLSDNGPNSARFNAGMRGIKGSLHEGGSRVPFFLRYPARFKTSRTISQIAAHIDLLPTLAELCGAPLPKTQLDGRSLVPLLEGKTDNWPDRTLFCQHTRQKNRAALRTQQYRAVNEGKGWQLFDMENDAGQKNDIAAQNPQVVARLAAEYETWWKSLMPVVQEPIPPIEIGHAPENPVDISAAQARLEGGLQFSGKYPNNAWLIGWTSDKSIATWNLNVVHGGTYEVELEYLCPPENAGAKVRVVADEASLEGTIGGTEIKQVPSPDRVPREEVYEMAWARLPLGKIELPEGALKLTVQTRPQAGRDALWLKSVRLHRLD